MRPAIFRPGPASPRMAPAEIEFDKLLDWSKHPNPGVRCFSGVATYRGTFDVADSLLAERDRGARIFLDLGRVAVMARVSAAGVTHRARGSVATLAGLLRTGDLLGRHGPDSLEGGPPAQVDQFHDSHFGLFDGPHHRQKSAPSRLKNSADARRSERVAI